MLAEDTSTAGSSFPIFSDLHSQPSSDSYSYSSPASYEMTPDSSPNSSLNSNSHSSSFPSGYDLEASGTLEFSNSSPSSSLGSSSGLNSSSNSSSVTSGETNLHSLSKVCTYKKNNRSFNEQVTPLVFPNAPYVSPFLPRFCKK